MTMCGFNMHDTDTGPWPELDGDVRKTFWYHVLGGHPHHHSPIYTGTCDGEGGCSHRPYTWLRTLDPVVSGTDQDVPNHKQSSWFWQRCCNVNLIKNDLGGSSRTMKWALRACWGKSFCAYVLPYHSIFLHTHFQKFGICRLKPTQSATTIFNVVSATQTHLAKIGATRHVVPTCQDMLATFPAKLPRSGYRCPWRKNKLEKYSGIK